MPLNLEKPNDELQRKFVEFLKADNYSAQEIEEAYHCLCGLNNETTASPPRVAMILKKMRELERLGLPINRFAETFRLKEEYENAENIYTGLVNSLAISENEKATLRSIAMKKRQGVITIFLAGGDESLVKIESAKQKIESKDDFVAGLLFALREALKVVPPGKKIEIQFEEN